jgi:hypothetical protein
VSFVAGLAICRNSRFQRKLFQAQKENSMKKSAKHCLTRVFVGFGLLLFSSAGWAATTTVNCPTEPKQNVPIASGDTYSGANCVLNTTGDVDSFTFNASAGDTWTVVGGVGTTHASDICVALNAPGSNGTHLFYGCTAAYGGILSTSTTMKLTVAGTYTIVVSEELNGETLYNLSLERISPAPTDATALTLSKNIVGSVPTPTGQEAYTFYGATSGTYEIAVSYTSGPDNACLNVYQSGTTVLKAGPPCTIYAGGEYTITEYVTPSANGTFVVDIYGSTDDETTNYNLEISCYSGTCPVQPPPPVCTLKDSPSYNASTETLTMTFTLATPAAATWNTWLTTGNTMQTLWSQSKPITEPAVTISKTKTGLPKSGKIGILSTLTTTTAGITCSSWTVVNTGTP